MEITKTDKPSIFLASKAKSNNKEVEQKGSKKSKKTQTKITKYPT